MIRVTVGSTTKRSTVVVNEDATVRSLLVDNGIDFSTSVIMLNGAPIESVDNTLAQEGVTEGDFLIATVKAKNALEPVDCAIEPVEEEKVKKEVKPTLRLNEIERQAMYVAAVEKLMEQADETNTYVKNNNLSGVPAKIMKAQAKAYEDLALKINEFITE